MGLAAERNGPFGIVQHGGGLHVSAGLVDHEFHTGVLQIGELHQGCIQRHFGKTSASGGNKHS